MIRTSGICEHMAQRCSNYEQTFEGLHSKRNLLVAFILLLLLDITVGRINGFNFKPTFRENNRPKKLLTVNLPEDEKPGHVIANLRQYAEDEENDKLTFGIDSSGAQICRVDPHSGVITLKYELDREARSDYKFRAFVSDAGEDESKRRSYLNVYLYVNDVNDNKPRFEGTPYHVTIDEGTPIGSVIARAHASDRDIKHNSLVRYSFDREPVGKRFAIDSRSGNVTVNGELDYEEKESYILFIKARDQGSPAQSSVTSLHVQLRDVNDTPPYFLFHHQARIVDENTPPGTIIATVSASDGDRTINSPIRYKIVGGDEYGLFSLDPVQGNLTVKGVLDREFYPEFKLEIKAFELHNSNWYDVTELRVALRDCNDNRPQFQGGPFEITVYDTSEVGRIVSDRLRAVDLDATFENNNLRYSLLGVEDGVFGISPQSGELILRKSLMNRVEDEYKFQAVVTEAQTRERYSDMANVTIQVKITCATSDMSAIHGGAYTSRACVTGADHMIITSLLVTWLVMVILPNR